MTANIDPASEKDVYEDVLADDPEYEFCVDDYDLSIDEEKAEYCNLINDSTIHVQKVTEIIYDTSLIKWVEYWKPAKKKGR